MNYRRENELSRYGGLSILDVVWAALAHQNVCRVPTEVCVAYEG